MMLGANTIKPYLTTLLLVWAVSTSCLGATKVLNTIPSGKSVDHVQVWLGGGAAFNAGSYAATPTIYALNAASTMKVWASGNSGSTTGTYNSASVMSYWGVTHLNGSTKEYWQNWLGDKTSNLITNKVAVLEAPAYINGCQIDYRINFASNPGPGATVNIQYYKAGVFVEARKYTKLTAAGSEDITNVTNTAWSLDTTPAGQGSFDPGFISLAPPYVDVATIAELKTQVGKLVRLTNTVTVACVSSGKFFVEEGAFKGCIKVVSNDTVAAGAFLKNLVGNVSVDTYGQYTLTLTDPIITATTGNTVKTVGVSNKSAKTDAKLLTNLVKVWGRVGDGVDYTISDGYSSPITVKKGVSAKPAGVAVVSGVLWKENEDVVLYQTATPVPVSGRVTDQDGVALVGAKVYFKSSPNASVNPQFTITVDAEGNYSQAVPNGTWYITASADSYAAPTEQSVVVNGAAVSDIDFTLNYIVTHAITASAGAGGTITPSGVTLVVHGANQTFTIAPNLGYAISDVVVDGVSKGAIATYTFSSVTITHAISATFVVSPTRTITASAGTGGTITPSGAVVVNTGTNKTFSIAANASYTIADVVVDGVSQGAIASYTFSNVTANHTISATFTAQGLAGVITGPYLQAMTQNSIYVLAETATTTPVMVEWGEKADYNEKSYTESTEPTNSSPVTYVHNVKLPGLQPNRLYHYCLTINGIRGVDHTFTTMVNPGTSFRFAFKGDYKGATTVPDGIATQVLAAKPLFSLYAGDLCNTDSSDTMRRELFRGPELALDATVPFFNAVGNHETWGVSTKAFTQSPHSSSGTQAYYSFDCGDAHFTCINNYSPGGYSLGSAEYNWVASDLAASNKPWKIAWFHNPAYTSTSDGHGSDPNMQIMCRNLFVPNHVDMVFNNHNHFYQHNLVDGIHHMIVGSAGASLYTPTNADFTYNGVKIGETLMSVKTWCYALIDMTPSSLKCVVYDHTGAVLDTVNLTKQFTISGKVSNSGGTGIYNAVVAVGGTNSNITPVVTDASGNYMLNVPGPGTYEVYADGPGYSANFSSVTLSTSGTVTNNVILASATEAGVYNGNFETAAGSLPDGWETFIRKPNDGLDYYGNAWPDKPDMYSFSQSTAGNTTPSGAASALLATANRLTNYGLLRIDRQGVSGEACTGITETTVTDTKKSWSTNYYGSGANFVQLSHGGNNWDIPPTMSNDYRVVSNNATTLTLADGSNIATAGYVATDRYRFLKEVRNYWYTGGIRTTAGKRIAVDRSHVYNFYFKQKTTYTGTESDKCHNYALVWRNASGNEISRSEWKWKPGSLFTQSTPRLFLAPPVGSATVEVCIATNCVDNGNAAWSDSSYIDDLVVDPVSATATNLISSLADNTHVIVPANATSLAPRDIAGERYTNYFYVSEPDGSAGIRIQNLAAKMDNFNVNDVVGISGVVKTASNGEKYVQANILGASIPGAGATPAVVTVATALTDTSAVGRFVSITASVTSIAADVSSFNITDASGTIKVNSVGFPLLSTFASVGTPLRVNGVVSREGATRVILLMNYSRQTTPFVDNDITFFAISDPHYGGHWATRYLHKQRIQAMNALPGAAYPSAIGGVVGECRGVPVMGDITDNTNDKAGQFAEFAMDFGLNGQNQLRYPVYEGLGNHDDGIVAEAADAIKARNPFRPGLTNISADSLNYAWDWGRVHFIQMNEAGSYLNRENLEWIKADLAANVGTSGRPVVLLQHEGFDDFSLAFYSRGESKRLYDAIKNYNIIAILWGHTGGYAQYKWGGIDVFGCDGSMEMFHVFHITQTELICTVRKWSDNTWVSNWQFRKNITGM